MEAVDVVMKHRPSDFMVKECLFVDGGDAAQGPYKTFLLRKCGFTTMEAVRLIAQALRVPAASVSYAGLKDEDGVTEQTVAVLTGSNPVEYWQYSQGREDEWLEIRSLGFSTSPLQIGKLVGNSFKLWLRNLTELQSEYLWGISGRTFCALNYYDTQRFGVPGGPKRTHHLGEAILNGRWSEALSELKALKSPESRLADAWSGAPSAFFDTLDPRVVNFFLSATASSWFNKELRDKIESCIPARSRANVKLEGLDYLYVESSAHAQRIGIEQPYLTYQRLNLARPSHREGSRRNTIIQAPIRVGKPVADDVYIGRQACVVEFFLPSGSYATAFIRQLTVQMDAQLCGASRPG